MEGGKLLRDRFAMKQIRSKAFVTLYAEVMGLVEKCSVYYDTQGRADRSALAPAEARIFQSYWLYLTTGLMNVSAATLMLRDAADHRIGLDVIADEIGNASFLSGGSLESRRDCLPAAVVEMIERLEHLKTEVTRYIRIVAPRELDDPDRQEAATGRLPGPQAA